MSVDDGDLWTIPGQVACDGTRALCDLISPLVYSAPKNPTCHSEKKFVQTGVLQYAVICSVLMTCTLFMIIMIIACKKRVSCNPSTPVGLQSRT